MRKIIDYDGTQEDILRKSTEQSAEGFILTEVQDYFDGHHLVFDDGQPVISMEDRVTALETKVKNLETKEGLTHEISV